MNYSLYSRPDHLPCAKCGDTPRVPNMPYCLKCRREIAHASYLRRKNGLPKLYRPGKFEAEYQRGFAAATDAAAEAIGRRADAYRNTKAPGWEDVVHECAQCIAAIRALSQPAAA